MCGLTGFYSPQGFALQPATEVIIRMTQSLRSRGPDDHGVWLDETKGIALGHQRLAILDLSPAGHQPMLSVSGRFVLAFNGEIYNHQHLREQLPVQEWRGHSDTETLLAGIECWGLERTLKAAVGMFALALWDREESTLSLARDRMGEKPLYYGWQGRTFLFGSELKAIQKHPDFLKEIDRDATALYVRHGYVPAPHCIFRGLSKLSPGAIAVLRGGSAPGGIPVISYYWQLEEVIERQAALRFRGVRKTRLSLSNSFCNKRLTVNG